jgi:hypothetical protein
MATELKLSGTALHLGITDLRIEGEARVDGVAFRSRGRAHSIACDGVGYGLNLRSETQLADLAGCSFRYDARDSHRRTSRRCM